jgi:hypothetical protein
LDLDIQVASVLSKDTFNPVDLGRLLKTGGKFDKRIEEIFSGDWGTVDGGAYSIEEVYNITLRDLLSVMITGQGPLEPILLLRNFHL